MYPVYIGARISILQGGRKILAPGSRRRNNFFVGLVGRDFGGYQVEKRLKRARDNDKHAFRPFSSIY